MRKIHESRIDRVAIFFALLVFLVFTARVVYFNLASDRVLIAAVPDDAFYYIQMATHRVREGFWSFDGVFPATGFHLLYGYFLYFIILLFGNVDWRVLSIVVDFMAVLSISISAWLTIRSVQAAMGDSAAVLAVAPYFAPLVLMQATSMMESWMVLLFSSLTIYLIVKGNGTTKIGSVSLLLTGFFGSLSRSDFGLFGNPPSKKPEFEVEFSHLEGVLHEAVEIYG